TTLVNPTTTASNTSPGTKADGFAPGAPGSLVVKPAGGGTLTMQWSDETFTQAGTIQADPDPALGVTLTRATNQLVGVVATATNGAAVTKLNAPLGLVFTKSKKHYVPVSSSDGKHFHKIPLLSRAKLPASQPDGYYLFADGRLEILTHHLTDFGVLSP